MDYILELSIIISIYSILAISLNYIAGYTGILSIAQAAFFGIGAYSTAILMIDFQMNFLAAMPLAFLITMIIAGISSIFILKLKGDSLMLVSFGFALIVYNVLLNLKDLTNGALGIKRIPAPEFLGVDFSDRTFFLILCLFLLGFTYCFFHRIVKSSYGRVLNGIRENELVMENSGHNTKLYKYSVFIIGSAFAGIAGALFATNSPYFISPTNFNLIDSVLILVIIIFGGFGNIHGSIPGVIAIILFPEALRFLDLPQGVFAELRQILYGLLLFGLIYFRPQGLFGKYKL